MLKKAIGDEVRINSQKPDATAIIERIEYDLSDTANRDPPIGTR